MCQGGHYASKLHFGVEFRPEKLPAQPQGEKTVPFPNRACKWAPPLDGIPGTLYVRLKKAELPLSRQPGCLLLPLEETGNFPSPPRGGFDFFYYLNI